ncbi:MAG TPA: YdcF family protein [Sedimenticola thiotaurini]|uniref:YdcF family protein n=1 Tax=Sedimenticola thiotaurini TaxID=1543721 RepID=A0A831RPQ3_9GAMM|nr:YdcF family protein [Sedimenticola thiotaurini]
MGQEVVWVLKALILPPGGPILLGVLGLALGRRFLGRLLVVLSLALLYLFSTPYVAGRLMAPVETIAPLSTRQARASGADAIVLLGGGRYADAPEYGGDTVNGLMLERVRYAARLARQTGLPVVISGGSLHGDRTAEAELARQVLEQEFDVEVAATESASRTTWDNAYLTRDLLRSRGIGRVLLVTHAMHMPRALEAFQRAGIDAVPAPTRFFHVDDGAEELSDWLPDPRALLISYYALHEQLGRLWYRLREHL